MKKINYLLLSSLILAAGAQSCSSSSNEPESTLSAKDQALKDATAAYVENTVLPTYKGMADNAIALYDDCVEIQKKHAAGTLAKADIEKAANHWKGARKYWELSEAFLFGPAADYNIDPHIDSWPLDKAAMDRLLAEIRNGAEYSIDNNFGYGLLGFHSIEYMLFELSADGQTSSIHSTDYTPEELAYLVIVAEDLRNQCVCLEACWAGTDNVSEEKQTILEEADIDKNKNYGWMIMNAGQAGSVFKTYQQAGEQILQGCIDIADVVGNTKIGRPNSSSSEEDRNYIESPYSLNSIEDFADNIKSIRNSYQGSSSGDKSISDYIKSVNPTLDAKVRKQIDDAISAIEQIPEPFAKNATGAAATNAVKVVGTDLVGTLEEAYQEIVKNR